MSFSFNIPFKVEKASPVNPWSGKNAFRIRIDDDYRTFSFPSGRVDPTDSGVNTAAVVLANGHDSFTVDWGDGSAVETYTNLSKRNGVSHTYAANGDYDVVISNDISAFSFYSKVPELTHNEHVIAVHNLASEFTGNISVWHGDMVGFTSIFAGCTNLETVCMSESGITRLSTQFGSPGRFDGLCDKLRTVDPPNGLKTLDDRAFYSLGAWQGGIDIPDGLVEIGTNINNYNTFRDTPFEYVHLPSTLERIGGRYHFYQASYPVIIDAVVPPTVASGEALASFRGSFYVPDSSVDAYKSAQYWSDYATRILPRSEYHGAIS